jgi:hypothetical protein
MRRFFLLPIENHSHRGIPMNAKDVMVGTLGMGDHILYAYLGDLSDSDLLLRPVEGQNHIAWQLGHLISSERSMVEGVKPGSCPPLPAGFAEAHNKEASSSSDTKNFLTKQQYLDLYKSQRAATLKVLESLSETDFDGPGPENMRSFCPTVGATFGLVGQHVLMHVGQFVSVRRKLKKPVSI